MVQRRRSRDRWSAFISFTREVYTRYGEDRVPLAAGAITFFLLLSLVPVLLLIVSLATFFFHNAQEAYERFNDIAAIWGPEIARVIGNQVSTLVENRELSLLISLVLGFLAGSQIFLILESAMNLTWRATRKRPYWARRGLASLMVLIVGVLLGLAVILTNAVRFLSRIPLPQPSSFAHEIALLKNILITVSVSFIIPTLLVAVIFGTIYKILPTRRITVRSIIPGALFAAILWEITLHLFGWYMTTAIQRYTLVYGSLSGLVLFMLWLYYSAQVFILGAEMSAVYHARLASHGDADEQRVDAEV